jgi:hypothetical protein
MESQPPVPPETPAGASPVPPETPAAASPPPAPPPSPPAAVAPLPWEQPGAPLLESCFATIRLVLFRPREAFARMAPGGSYARPIVFALILGVLGICVSAGYDWLIGDPMSELWSRFGDSGGPDIPRFAVFLLAVFGSPLLTALTVLISALIYHLFLLIFGGSGGGFGATFRVVCYSLAGNVWAFVPFAGQLVSAAWVTVAAILGLSVAHRIGVGKAAAAVLLPVALCCACCAPFAIWRLLGRM